MEKEVKKLSEFAKKGLEKKAASENLRALRAAFLTSTARDKYSEILSSKLADSTKNKKILALIKTLASRENNPDLFMPLVVKDENKVKRRDGDWLFKQRLDKEGNQLFGRRDGEEFPIGRQIYAGDGKQYVNYLYKRYGIRPKQSWISPWKNKYATMLIDLAEPATRGKFLKDNAAFDYNNLRGVLGKWKGNPNTSVGSIQVRTLEDLGNCFGSLKSRKACIKNTAYGIGLKRFPLPMKNYGLKQYLEYQKNWDANKDTKVGKTWKGDVGPLLTSLRLAAPQLSNSRLATYAKRKFARHNLNFNLIKKKIE